RGWTEGCAEINGAYERCRSILRVRCGFGPFDSSESYPAVREDRWHVRQAASDFRGDGLLVPCDLSSGALGDSSRTGWPGLRRSSGGAAAGGDLGEAKQ